MGIRINSVVYKNGRFKVKQEIPGSSGKNTNLILGPSDEDPGDKFKKALSSLLPEALDALEIDTDEAGNYQVVGVEFFHGGKKKTFGAKIKLQKILKNSEIRPEITAPRKIQALGESDESPDAILSDAGVKNLKKLEKECINLLLFNEVVLPLFEPDRQVAAL